MIDDVAINTAISAFKRGQYAEAEALCRSRLGREPHDSDALLVQAMSLQALGRNDESACIHGKLTELRPDDDVCWGNYATILTLIGDVDGASHAAEAAVRLAPDSVDHLEQLGLLKLQLHRAREAQPALLRACELSPNSARIHIYAASACVACRELRAEDLLQSWRDWLPLPGTLQLQLADLLVQTNKVWDATEVLEDLTRREPGNWPAQLLLSKAYERVNRLTLADAKLRSVIEESSTKTCADAGFWREINLQKSQLFMRRHDYVNALEFLEEAGPRDDDDEGYYFSLAKICDRLGDTHRALASLETAHGLQTSGIRVTNPDLLRQEAPLLPQVDQYLGEDDYRKWPTLKAPMWDQSPVFVVGFPRSGTTLLEQMLDAHPNLQSMDERPFLNNLADQLTNIGVRVPHDLGKLDQRDCDELRKGYMILSCGKVERQWNLQLIDKNPLNLLWLPLIHRIFPNAKFIFALRHPCDVVWSCYLQNFHAAPLAVACRTLSNLANAYVATMQNWLCHVRLLRPDVYVSRYEDLVSKTSDQTSEIAEFLELADSAPMLDFHAHAREKGFIRTPSYTQVVHPIDTQGVDHWKLYASAFDDITPILQPMLDLWDYGT